jgi:choline dehydrogenase-like flavoprotein
MLISLSEAAKMPDCDLCIIGAGPVGIALALSCERSGMSVLLIESGREQPDPFATALSAGHVVNAERHAPAEIAVHRGLGGTSRWWGGRCVPLDDVDFADRPGLGCPGWPISHAEIAAWYEAAAAFFGIGPARFTASAGCWSRFGDVRCEQFERWTPENDVGRRHRLRLSNSHLIRILLGATVTELHLSEDDQRVAALTVADARSRFRIEPRRVVIACGGLETTRLLLQAQQHRPQLFGGPNGPLGRGYMGHLSGKIADIVLADPASASIHDFFLDQGVFARRRLTLTSDAQTREQQLNIAFWADNPPFYLPGHGNGILSMAWLALAIPWIGRRLVAEGVRVSHVGPRPYRWARHICNVARAPLPTLRQIGAILHARVLASPRKPGFLIRSRDGRYALHYLAEQAPCDQSRVTLSTRKDALGLPFLVIDLRYGDVDAQSVLRAHNLLDDSLRRAGLGRLEFRDAPQARLTAILRQAKDGFHQIGTTRMASRPQDGVVDADCRVHGIENLYVASSSVFPRSSQANPTFPAVALALRLAAHLADQVQQSKLAAVA